MGGQLRVGTPLYAIAPEQDGVKEQKMKILGNVQSIKNGGDNFVQKATQGEQVTVRIDVEQNTIFDRVFKATQGRFFLFSAMTRPSIDVLKELYREELEANRPLVLSIKRDLGIP